MTKLQQWLRSAGTPETLKEEFGIKMKHHRYLTNLRLFKYSQIDSPMHEPIVQESRGIVLDADNDWEIVGRGFDKFFNHGEPNAHPIDWSSAQVQEKLDGSLIHVYFYRGVLQVATTGTPDGLNPVGAYDVNFRELFLESAGKAGLVLNNLQPGLSYLFELMTPYNRVVVHHDNWKVKFLAARRHSDGAYVYPTALRDYAVRTFPFVSIEEVVANANSLRGTEQEGYVVVDKHNNRVKVKGEDYVRLHYFVSSATPKALLEAVRSGEIDEAIHSFPDLKDELINTKNKLDDFVRKVEETFAEIKHLDAGKVYALKAREYSFSHFLFVLKSGKIGSLREYLTKIPIDGLKKHLSLVSDEKSEDHP